MAKTRVTAKQKSARRKNIAVARKAKKKIPAKGAKGGKKKIKIGFGKGEIRPKRTKKGAAAHKKRVAAATAKRKKLGLKKVDKKKEWKNKTAFLDKLYKAGRIG